MCVCMYIGTHVYNSIDGFLGPQDHVHAYRQERYNIIEYYFNNYIRIFLALDTLISTVTAFFHFCFIILHYE